MLISPTADSEAPSEPSRPPPQEGMVHLTQMKQGNKMVSVSQLVKRNQRVFVKVVSVLGERLPGAAPGLSPSSPGRFVSL